MATNKDSDIWTVEFFEDDRGTEPAKDWLKDLKKSDPDKHRAVVVAMLCVLEPLGTDVCSSEWGKNLGEGLYEFRVRHTADETRNMFPQTAARAAEIPGGATAAKGKLALRVYFTTHGRKLILLLGGYDKGRFGSKRQDKSIKQARKSIKQLKHQRQKKKRRR